MSLVRMAVSLFGKAKGVPGYIKHPPVEWLGNDQVEGYVNSSGELVLEIHRDKVTVDSAKLELPKLEKEVGYFQNQVSKINKELQEGRLGRKGDLDKFEAKLAEFQDEVRIKRSLIDGAVVDVIRFPSEDCE